LAKRAYYRHRHIAFIVQLETGVFDTSAPHAVFMRLPLPTNTPCCESCDFKRESFETILEQFDFNQ
jgi:hypothetical protein